MRIIKSKLLNDGKLFNDGRRVDLIHIEDIDDFEILWRNIVNFNYYNTNYFKNQIGYKEKVIKFDAFFLSTIIKFLKPKSVLELGCGRGDVLFLLNLYPEVRVRGIEFSLDVFKSVWPSLANKLDFGDVLDVCRKYNYQTEKMFFNTFCAFDFWEHLYPQKLHEYINSMVDTAEKDTLFFFNIPAIGVDRVFGEIFPLELEENRDKFTRRLPFDYLIAESINSAIPANGHLIWAHTEWWQKQFEDHGLVRAEELEKNIHTFFDEHLYYAKKSFYIFYLNSPEARYRVKELTQKSLTFYKKWKLLVDLQEYIGRFIEKKGETFIDLEELRLTVNHAEFYMILDLRKRLKSWIAKFQGQAKSGIIRQLMQFLLYKLTDKCLDDYIKIYKKRHYLIQ